MRNVTHLRKLYFAFLCFILLNSFSFAQETVSTANGDFPAGINTVWKVPANVYSIVVTAEGAGGGDGSQGEESNRGGFGAIVSSAFPVMPGDILNIIVGKRGQDGLTPNDGGGGGGSGIYNVTTASTLIVAGGGGGGHRDRRQLNNERGYDGRSFQGTLGGGGPASMAGGGGGANGAGAGGNQSSMGGGQGLTTGGIGGTPANSIFMGSGGGFGFGGGGGSITNAGGGGGGATGGAGGIRDSRGGQGGHSYFDLSASEVTVFGTTLENVDGAITIMYEAMVVPTLDQWGLIVLELIMFVIGIVTIRQFQKQLAIERV